MVKEKELNRSMRVRPEDMEAAIHPIKKRKILDTQITHKPVNQHTNKDETEGSIIYCFWKDRDYITEKEYPALDDIELDNGEILYAEDRPEACAIQTKMGTGYKFEVKFDRKSRSLYNPKDVFGTKPNQTRDGQILHQLNAVNQLRWITIDEIGFNHYLNFLKTNNNSYLIKANRQM